MINNERLLFFLPLIHVIDTSNGTCELRLNLQQKVVRGNVLDHIFIASESYNY